MIQNKQMCFSMFCLIFVYMWKHYSKTICPKSIYQSVKAFTHQMTLHPSVHFQDFCSTFRTERFIIHYIDHQTSVFPLGHNTSMDNLHGLVIQIMADTDHNFSTHALKEL